MHSETGKWSVHEFNLEERTRRVKQKGEKYRAQEISVLVKVIDVFANVVGVQHTTLRGDS